MRTQKIRWKCSDGPFAGQRILLAADGRSLVFTVRGVTGRYITEPAAVAAGVRIVRWEALK